MRKIAFIYIGLQWEKQSLKPQGPELLYFVGMYSTLNPAKSAPWGSIQATPWGAPISAIGL